MGWSESRIRIEETAMVDGDMRERTILIYGKGAKERRIQIGSDAVMAILEKYVTTYREGIQKKGFFFVNQAGAPISDQSIRRMIRRYTA